MSYLNDIKKLLEFSHIYCEMLQVGSHLGSEQLVAYDPSHTHSKNASVALSHDGSHVYMTMGDFDTLRQSRLMVALNSLTADGASKLIHNHFGL